MGLLFSNESFQILVLLANTATMIEHKTDGSSLQVLSVKESRNSGHKGYHFRVMP